MSEMAEHFAARLRGRQTIIGYWISTDNPPATERIAGNGFDYVCLDLQHGLLDYHGMVAGLMAIDAGGSNGVVRVPANDVSWIGKALDAGARAVIVPLVNTAEEAARAASACRYPPDGIRSFGPVRSAIRIGSDPRTAGERVACIVMIETAEGLANAAAIAATPGIDAVYIGPADLSIGIGGGSPQHGWTLPEFGQALTTIQEAAAAAGVGCGLHTNDGQAAADALAQGFTFVSISSDLSHLTAWTRRELDIARGEKE
jgi:4-hydroxy-2-oxoheptanedioate aldolase